MVEEADRLEVLDADDLADGALVEQAPHEPRVGRVAQHVRDAATTPARSVASAIATHSASVVASGFSISSA